MAAAHRGRRAELVAERAHRLVALEQLRDAEWRVAHRELQLARSFSYRNPRYMRVRQELLDEARTQLEAARARAIGLGLPVPREGAAV